MRVKHNKKRNTAFLYELLVKELTKAVVAKDAARKRFVANLIKENFASHTALGRELDCYRTLLETNDMELHLAEKLLYETKTVRHRLDSKRIFDSQTKVINKINKTLSKEAWNTFVPNFKSLATVAAIFNTGTPPKQRVLHEDTVIKLMHGTADVEDNMLEPIDNIVYRSFVKKFNEEYDPLLTEQKELLGKYIASFADNGLELKVYLSEEIGRLKSAIQGSLKMEEVFADEQMMEKTKKVLHILEGFKNASPTKDLVYKVLTIQELAREVATND